jgi:hypothetical protein
LHDENVQPGLSDVIFVVLTVEQSTSSFQLIVTLPSNPTPVAPSEGFVDETPGAVLSTVTVLPAEGVSILPEASVALLWME